MRGFVDTLKLSGSPESFSIAPLPVDIVRAATESHGFVSYIKKLQTLFWLAYEELNNPGRLL